MYNLIIKKIASLIATVLIFVALVYSVQVGLNSNSANPSACCQIKTEENKLLALADHYFKKEQMQHLQPIDVNLPETSLKSDLSLISYLLSRYQGFSIGEYHSDLAPKDFLVQYMQSLKQHGVKVLFMEQFWDDSQKDLDAYINGGTLSQKIKSKIANSYFPNGYLEVIEAAKENGIRVVAIDTRSAHTPNLPNRWKGMNYFAYKTMQRVLQDFGKNDKYVVLLGAAHLSRIEQDTPGVAELCQTPRLAIIDKARAMEAACLSDAERLVANHIPGDEDLKVDLVIQRNSISLKSLNNTF